MKMEAFLGEVHFMDVGITSSMEFEEASLEEGDFVELN